MSSLAVIVLIVLVDLLGFSMVMPLLGPFAEQYGFHGWQIGLLFSAYPVCQLVAGPILGRLSDRHGRRPLLVFSQAGTASFVSHSWAHTEFLRDVTRADARRGFAEEIFWSHRPTWRTSPGPSIGRAAWG